MEACQCPRTLPFLDTIKPHDHDMIWTPATVILTRHIPVLGAGPQQRYASMYAANIVPPTSTGARLPL